MLTIGGLIMVAVAYVREAWRWLRRVAAWRP